MGIIVLVHQGIAPNGSALYLRRPMLAAGGDELLFPVILDAQISHLNGVIGYVSTF